MNFSQRLGLFILILITFAYIYFSFFNNTDSKSIKLKNNDMVYNPLDAVEKKDSDFKPLQKSRDVKIYFLDNSGNLKTVKRSCDINDEKSCFEYAIKELISGPTKWEKSKGFTSEIPSNTKILSIRESNNAIMIDLSSNFESGGGAESIYARVHQIIKTGNANTSTPIYLYINGKQANVIGGEGIMIKQPLNERSFDE